jgi:hypothetical protein
MNEMQRTSTVEELEVPSACCLLVSVFGLRPGLGCERLAINKAGFWQLTLAGITQSFVAVAHRTGSFAPALSEPDMVPKPGSRVVRESLSDNDPSSHVMDLKLTQ